MTGLFYLICSILYYTTLVHCLEKEITFNVDPGKQDCFYQAAKKGDVIDVDYQVIDGGHGDLDITFHLVDPTGRILVADFKKSENNHRADASMDGDYKFCFDNTFSGFNSKAIFFELIIEGEDDGEWSNDKLEGLQPEEVYDLQVQDIEEILNTVKTQVTKVRHLQDLIKSSEARDRNVAEENYFKVNTFSMVQIAVMCFVGLIQVILLRSLFDEKSKVHNIWKKLNGR
ncbi:transmembrane emp24 domain-containing protein 5 [Aethina tumida]|uniref:transmembrane emp24 domain-containing protein 5 n=1 Tax=Aethina tumida TaxID=116153 RepID=UPI00096B5C25|nr:transmembrane emp24 domain-containing protein 5 [Aethina tumida]